MMAKKMLFVAIIAVIAIVVIGYVAYTYYVKPSSPSSGKANLLTQSQVIAALGTGWYPVAQYTNYTPAVHSLNSTTSLSVTAYAAGNFTNGGGPQLIDQWIQFGGGGAQIYYNIALNAFNGMNMTKGTQGTFSYVYFSMPGLNATPPVSLMYAQSGAHFIEIVENGGAFTNQQGTQMLSDQIANLGLS